jgi:cell division protein FtsL
MSASFATSTDVLLAMDAHLRRMLAAEARLAPAQRRARNAEGWTAQQRYEERIAAHNAQVERINRERGRARNTAQAAAIRTRTCGDCFQLPAANGECGC